MKVGTPELNACLKVPVVLNGKDTYPAKKVRILNNLELTIGASL
ncbi:MAG TPA: hypothetical protein PKN57_12415 [Saprospiraceae bacterium]|nr:hypothetical protein [Saprospiraceae bacterium]HMW74779.1 hypothetical protein [Saprospiraceae bacterium]HMX83608.1 hypothetical protein [Saprospiraceae bacterium]HMX86327.1 hypothetical protein [Saprospiraceae bacterium]HMZ73034.1 hypothetical protein [Saprospiraceae bacterium]